MDREPDGLQSMGLQKNWTRLEPLSTHAGKHEILASLCSIIKQLCELGWVTSLSFLLPLKMKNIWLCRICFEIGHENKMSWHWKLSLQRLLSGSWVRIQGFRLYWHYLEVTRFLQEKIAEDHHRQTCSYSLNPFICRLTARWPVMCIHFFKC